MRAIQATRATIPATITAITAMTTLATIGTVAAASPAAADASVPYYHQQQSNDCEASVLRMVLAARGHTTTDADILRHIGVDLIHRQVGISGPGSGNPY